MQFFTTPERYIYIYTGNCVLFMLFMFIKVFLDISLKLVDPKEKQNRPCHVPSITSKPTNPQTLGCWATQCKRWQVHCKKTHRFVEKPAGTKDDRDQTLSDPCSPMIPMYSGWIQWTKKYNLNEVKQCAGFPLLSDYFGWGWVRLGEVQYSFPRFVLVPKTRLCLQ